MATSFVPAFRSLFSMLIEHLLSLVPTQLTLFENEVKQTGASVWKLTHRAPSLIDISVGSRWPAARRSNAIGSHGAGTSRKEMPCRDPSGTAHSSQRGGRPRFQIPGTQEPALGGRWSRRHLATRTPC